MHLSPQAQTLGRCGMRAQQDAVKAHFSEVGNLAREGVLPHH